jgi:hypothetical protein
MVLDPLPLPPITLTPTPNPRVPPAKPPEPFLTTLFPERTPFHAPDNPFVGSLPKETEEKYKCTLKEVITDLRGPFVHDSLEPLSFRGNSIGANLSPESFNAAVTITLMALEYGYYPSQNNPLSTKDWARLACSVIAATGRGFHKTSALATDSSLEKIRVETTDDNPIDLCYPSLFHRLAAIADHLEHSVSTDLDDYQMWYYNIRQKTEKSLARLAMADLEEKWQEWKADQVDR